MFSQRKCQIRLWAGVWCQCLDKNSWDLKVRRGESKFINYIFTEKIWDMVMFSTEEDGGWGHSLRIEVVMLKIKQTVRILTSCTVPFNLQKELPPWINEIEANWYSIKIPFTYRHLTGLVHRFVEVRKRVTLSSKVLTYWRLSQRTSVSHWLCVMTFVPWR